MAQIVLVHGAWHGGWCWARTARRLRAAGHEVYTPTLTGLGERAHLLSPDVDLATHGRDVASVLEYEDLTGVVLVGHSYGGVVTTVAAGTTADRVAHLVYLDAYVPRDGLSLINYVSPDRRRDLDAHVREAGDGWRLPGPRRSTWEDVIRGQYLIQDEADVRWMLERLTPHPYRTWTEPVHGTDAAVARLRRTYIRCTEYHNPAFDRFAADAGAPGSGWALHTLRTSHDPMVTHPAELAGLLDSLA